MERPEYEKLDQVEDRMWWFGALHRNLLMLAGRFDLDTVNRPILDAGCGTGGLLLRLAHRYPRVALLGLDLDPLACARHRQERSAGLRRIGQRVALRRRRPCGDFQCRRLVSRRCQRARCVASFPPLSRREWLAHSQLAGLSLDAVAARRRRRQYAALHGLGPPLSASSRRFSSGLCILLECTPFSADGTHAKVRPWEPRCGERRQAVPPRDRAAWPCGDEN